jgi:hypothetical protein
MGQDKMTPMIVLLEILLCEHWLSTWPTALGLEKVYVGTGQKRLFFTRGEHATVFQVKITAI